MEKSKIKKLFSNLCCSACKEDFEEESFEIIRQEHNLIVVRIVCGNCGKSFGVALLGLNELSLKNSSPFEIVETPHPISSNEVLDAHNFIKNLDEDWTKYIPQKYK